MPGAARVGDQLDHGGYIIQGSPTATSDGMGDARVSDMAMCQKHGLVYIVDGANTMTADGNASARSGSKCSCGATIINGSPTRDIGDNGGAGPAVTFTANGVTINFTEQDLGSELDDPDSGSAGLAIYPPVIGRAPYPVEIARSQAITGTAPAPTPVSTDTDAGATKATTPVSGSLTSPLDYTQLLSASWTLADVSTKTAISRAAIVAQHGLTDVQIANNLKGLCVNVLQPMSDYFSRSIMFATSGFRPGSSTSQHELGMAADIQFTDQRGSLSNDDYWARVQWVKENLPYDQFIIEYIGIKPWMHLSFNSASQRRQLLTAVRSGGTVKYVPGLQKIA